GGEGRSSARNRLAGERELPGQIQNLAGAAAEQLAERGFRVAPAPAARLRNRTQHERVLAGTELAARRHSISAAVEARAVRSDAFLDDRSVRHRARVRAVGL